MGVSTQHDLKERMKKIIPLLILVISQTTQAQIAENDIKSNAFSYDENVKWQKASIEDMHVFSPFIGRFRSKTRFSKNLQRSIHFILEYKWFDELKTTVKLQLSYVIEETKEKVVHSEGFYGFDPSTNRLYLMQIYASGRISFGGLEKFDTKTGRRLARVSSVNKDGASNVVRDEFAVLDKDSWKNTMYSRGNNEWRVTYEDVFTRINDE